MNSISKELAETKTRLQDLISLYQGKDDSTVENKEDLFTGKLFHNSTQTIIQDIINVYNSIARENYEKLMKTIGSIKSSRKAIQEYVIANNSASSQSDLNSQEKTKANKNCYGCLQNSLKSYFNFYSSSENIKSFTSDILKIRSDIVITFLRNSAVDFSDDIYKYIRNAIVNFNMANFKNKNLVYSQQIIGHFVKNISEAIKSSAEKPIQDQDLKIIYRQMVILVEICKSYQQELISLHSKPDNNNTENQKTFHEFWSNTLDHIYNIFFMVLDQESDSGRLNEFILCEVLKYIRNLIKGARNEESIKEKEEENKNDEKIEEESESGNEKMEMIIEEEKIENGKEREIYKEALRKVNANLIEKQLDSTPTKSISIINPIKANIDQSKSLKLNENNWLTKCLIHSNDSVAHISGLILKDLISEESKNSSLIFLYFF